MKCDRDATASPRGTGSTKGPRPSCVRASATIVTCLRSPGMPVVRAATITLSAANASTTITVAIGHGIDRHNSTSNPRTRPMPNARNFHPRPVCGARNARDVDTQKRKTADNRVPSGHDWVGTINANRTPHAITAIPAPMRHPPAPAGSTGRRSPRMSTTVPITTRIMAARNTPPAVSMPTPHGPMDVISSPRHVNSSQEDTSKKTPLPKKQPAMVR